MTVTHIPDEAVQAAKKAVFERCKKTYLTDDQMFAALTAALPHISAPCDVEVVDRNTLLSIPVIHNDSMDNLGIALASYFEGHLYCPEDGEMNDTDTWKQWALDKTNDLADRILSCVVTKPVDQEARDYEVIGHAYMAAFETVTAETSEWSGYTPSECPSELLLDIYAAQQEYKPVAVAAVRRQALEEAAKTAEKLDLVFDSKVGAYAAAAIRALKGQKHDK